MAITTPAQEVAFIMFMDNDYLDQNDVILYFFGEAFSTWQNVSCKPFISTLGFGEFMNACFARYTNAQPRFCHCKALGFWNLKADFGLDQQAKSCVPVLQTEAIVRLVLKISKNDNNIIWISLKNLFLLKVTRVWLKIWACNALLTFSIFSLLVRSSNLSHIMEIWNNDTNILSTSLKNLSLLKVTRL